MTTPDPTTIYDRLRALEIQLPDLAPPSGNYVHAVRSGNLLFLAGKAVGACTGKVGGEVTAADAKEYARTTTTYLIAAMHAELGDLEKVARIVKVNGFVNAAPDFCHHPEVMNGCSDLLVAVFGDRGRHARTSVGAGSTPDQVPVEIELIAEIHP